MTLHCNKSKKIHKLAYSQHWRTGELRLPLYEYYYSTISKPNGACPNNTQYILFINNLYSHFVVWKQSIAIVCVTTKRQNMVNSQDLRNEVCSINLQYIFFVSNLYSDFVVWNNSRLQNVRLIISFK